MCILHSPLGRPYLNYRQSSCLLVEQAAKKTFLSTLWKLSLFIGREGNYLNGE